MVSFKQYLTPLLVPLFCFSSILFLSVDTAGPDYRTNLPSKSFLKKQVFPKYTEKLKSFMLVKITKISSKEFLNSSTFHLKGTLTSLRPSDVVNFKWILPTGMTLLEGSLNDVFYDLAAGKSQSIQIKVKSENPANQKVFLKARSSHGNNVLTSTGQFNTLDQSKINTSRNKLFLKNKAYVKGKSFKVVY